jgi:hypothetical protein
MGRKLTTVPAARNTITSLVDSGAIARDKAASWKERLAQEEKSDSCGSAQRQVKLVRCGSLPTDTESANTV